MTNQITTDDKPIAVYNEFRAQLSELREANSKAVFDYEDEAGNKEARSHIFKLRKTKTAVDNARKTEKAASLAYGRRVDGEAKEIISEIEEMIEVHAAPIKEIEDREERRLEGIRAKLASVAYPEWIAEYEGEVSAENWQKALNEVASIEVDESFDEFMAKGTAEKKATLLVLESGLELALKREKERAELEELRAEKEIKERKEREARIAKDAAEAATKAAEKAAAEKDAEAQRAKDKAQAEQEKREANTRHTGKINKAAADAISIAGDITVDAAKNIVKAIVLGKIPNVTITY